MWREEQMGFYSRWILPQVIELTMRQKNFAPFRERTAGAKASLDRFEHSLRQLALPLAQARLSR
jgi:hypothetical protein